MAREFGMEKSIEAREQQALLHITTCVFRHKVSFGMRYLKADTGDTHSILSWQHSF